MPRAAWLAVAPLAALGVVIEILHIFVNVSYVYARENYSNFDPPYGFLFSLKSSQIVSHWRALMAWDYRVDTWVIGIARMQGAGRFLLIMVVLAALLAWCIRNLTGHLARAQGVATVPQALSFSSALSCRVLGVIAAIWLAFAGCVVLANAF
jgi:hypothetical protein